MCGFPFPIMSRASIPCYLIIHHDFTAANARRKLFMKVRHKCNIYFLWRKLQVLREPILTYKLISSKYGNFVKRCFYLVRVIKIYCRGIAVVWNIFRCASCCAFFLLLLRFIDSVSRRKCFSISGTIFALILLCFTKMIKAFDIWVVLMPFSRDTWNSGIITSMGVQNLDMYNCAFVHWASSYLHGCRKGFNSGLLLNQDAALIVKISESGADEIWTLTDCYRDHACSRQRNSSSLHLLSSILVRSFFNLDSKWVISNFWHLVVKSPK